MIDSILVNLEKVGFGALLFVLAYAANMGLGAWKNVKVDANNFNWKLIGNSVLKFGVVGISISVLSVVLSVVPQYITYVGIEIEPATMETIDGLIIVSSFLTATIRYAADAISKLKTILSVGNSTPEAKE